MASFIRRVVDLGNSQFLRRQSFWLDVKMVRVRQLSTHACRGNCQCMPRKLSLNNLKNNSLLLRNSRSAGQGTCRKSLHDNCKQMSNTTTDAQNTETLISAWFSEVHTFGNVCVQNVPFDVHIKPLNPVDYPDHNKSIVKMYYSAASNLGNSDTLQGRKLSELGKLCDLKVEVEEEGESSKVNVTCEVPSGVELPLLCVVNIPVKFDVEVKGEGKGSVTIGPGLESDNITVHMPRGDCHLSSLKTAKISVKCDEGSIRSSKQLLGAIQMQCGKSGSISGERFQGGSIECTTDAGDVDIKTIYAGKTTCSTQSGNLHIRDCHGDVTVLTVDGDLSIDSLDGKLSAQLETGTADVFVTRQDGVNIISKQGDVILKFAEETACSLDLDAKVIEKDESLKAELDSQGKGFLKSETETIVKASAPKGRISLKMQDWLSSIKLQFEKTSP